MRSGEPSAEYTVQWSGIILVNGRGQLLLNLRENDPRIGYPNCWNLIAGVVESGETPDECMVREMMEETGERLGAFEKFCELDVVLRDGRVARSHTYYAQLEKAASALLLGEGQEHRFFAPAELDALDIVPWTERVLRDFLASPEYLSRR